MKKRAFLCLVLLCCVILSSCNSEVRAEHCEIGIALPKNFDIYDSDGAFDLAYSSENLIVGITRLSFDAAIEDGIPATLEPSHFAAVYMSRAAHMGRIESYGDVPYYTYIVQSASLRYLVTFYKSPYAYFVITFITKTVGGVSLEDMLKLTGKVYLILD